MAKSDGTVYVDTIIDTKGFGKGVNTMQKQIGGLTGAIGKLGLAIAATFSVGKLIQFGKEAIDAAADAQAMASQFKQVFGELKDEATESLDSISDNTGIVTERLKGSYTQIAAFAKTSGMTEKEAMDLANRAMVAVADSAAFYDRTLEDTTQSLQSFLKGNYENDAALGLSATEFTRNAAAAELFGKSFSELTEKQKQLTLLKMVEDANKLSGAMGQAASESDTWSNVTGNLQQSLKNLGAAIGQYILPIAIKAVKTITYVIESINSLLNKLFQLNNAISSGGGGSPGAVLEETASGYDDVADSAKEATKAQNKYLTGLDEIRTFQEPQGSESGASGGGIGAISPAETEKGNEEVTETNSLMDKLVKKVKQLKDLFKQGFTDGLGDTTERVNSLKDSFESIKQSLSSIFDADFTQGLDGFIQSITQSFGTLTGSFASIGLTIGTNLLGGLSGFLESEAPNIKQYFLDMFDIGASLSEKGAELSSAFAYIFEAFANEDGQKITEDIIAIFAGAFMSITELIGQIALDITNFLVTPFVNSKEEIKAGFEDLLAGISEYTGSVRKVFEEFFELVSQFYNEHISPIFEKLMPDMEALWKEHIAPLLSKFGEFFGKLGENVSELWEEVFKPFIEWFSDNIMPVISPILEAVGRIFINLFGTIADVIGNILDILGGLIDFVVGVLTGDWEKAWNGIVDIFKGIFNGIANVAELVINTVIDIINGLIGGVNNITDKVGIPAIPEIPRLEIPMLATGAVIPPNAPFMAMLGDQKHGTNIEAPLDTIKQAVREVVGNGNSNGNVLHNVVQINRRTLLEEMIEEAKLRQSTSGRNPFDLA